MFSRVSVIAINSFKEIIRDRVLYGIILFSIFIIGLSRALGSLSFAEQERLVLDFGLAGVHISVVIISIFVGSTLISKELEKRTIITLLTRPVGRAEFIIGKFLGFLMVVCLLATLLFFVLFLVLFAMDAEINTSMFYALHGFMLEALVLISLTMAFGIYSKPMLSVSFVLGVFLIGHWMDSLNYFASRSDSKGFQQLGKVVNYVFPNLELWNWKTEAVNRAVVKSELFWNANLNAFAWTGLFLCVAVILFRRKDCA